MASGSNPTHILNKLAAEALAAHRLVIIDPSDADYVRYPEADYDTQLFGITAEAADSGDQVDIIIGGIAMLQVDGNVANIAWGDWIAAHDVIGYGRKVALSDGTTYREVIGKAFQAATADGAIIPVHIAPNVFQTA
ncbi:MAG: capsid cement protein [Kofleriaceae bacterium]